jgi:hypothetical protein
MVKRKPAVDSGAPPARRVVIFQRREIKKLPKSDGIFCDATPFETARQDQRRLTVAGEAAGWPFHPHNTRAGAYT